MPAIPIAAGQSRYYRYRLSTVSQSPAGKERALARATRTGRAGVPGQASWDDRSTRRFVIEFEGPGLKDGADVTLSAETRGGHLLEARLERLPQEEQVRRAVIVLAPDQSGGPSDMRVFLHDRGRALSEVWSYVWYPDEIDRKL